MQDFTVISEQDRRDWSYLACVTGSTGIGMTTGRLLGLKGLLLGAAAGLGYGLYTCRSLREPIKKKLFSNARPLTDQELIHALRAVRLETGVQSKSDAMYLLSAARIGYRNSYRHGSIAPSRLSSSPRASAQILLIHRVDRRGVAYSGAS